MKSISILPLLALAIPPTFPQPHNAAIDNTSKSAPINSRSNLVPTACHKTNKIVYDQLQEISWLQSKDLPTSHDGAGYLYAVFSGRKMLGCPGEDLISSNGNDTSASQQFKRGGETVDPMKHDLGFGDPCEVVRLLKDQVEAQMMVTNSYKIATPDYLAGWYAGTQDLDSGLNCGLVSHHQGSGSKNATVSAEE